MAGHYCSGNSAARSPVADYAIGADGSDYSSALDLANWSTTGTGCRATAGTDPWLPEEGAAADQSFGNENDPDGALVYNQNAPYNRFMCKSHGNVCAKGTYCEAGSSIEAACEAGRYCPDKYMKVAPDTTLKCHRGFYCKASNYKKTPGGPWTTTDEETEDTTWEDTYGKYCE